MHSRSSLAASALALAGLSYGAPAGSSSSSIDKATEFALTYGFPLYPFRNASLSTAGEVNGTNDFYHADRLADPTFRQVVSPNVDTLYSAAVLDLSHHDLILEVPEVTDRYYVFAIYDVWGDNYLNLGSTEGSAAGKYRIRYSPETSAKAGLELCSSTQNKRSASSECDGMLGIINAVTPYGSMQPRYAVKSGSDEEIQKISDYQNKSSLKKVPKSQKCDSEIPVLSLHMLNSSLSSDMATQVMQLTARIAPHNPPRNISDQARVNANLKAAGIENGHYKPKPNQHLEASFNKTQARMVAVAGSSKFSMSLGNNWTSLQEYVQGDFAEYYSLREYVSTTGYLMLTQSEALYPTYSSSELTLTTDESYLFTFESKPPLNDLGFWSLTAYNAEHFLIPNQEEVYSLGSNSNITYSDGTPVYGGDHEDTSFQLLIQPEGVTPPSNWTSNWIPAPAGGGDFSLILRLYGPTDGVTDGSWKAPLVTKQSAFTA